MPKRTDIKLTAEGMPGGTPVGCTITLQVGSIPTATVDLAPGEEGFADVDKIKRQDASIDLEVQTFISSTGNKITRKIKFEGLLDGMTIVNAVGSNSYQAVIKNRAQRLLELTTLTPGLYPTGINVYRHSDFGITTKGQTEDGKVLSWIPISKDVKIDQSCLSYYTALLKKVLEKQKDGWKTFLGNEKVLDNSTPFGKLFDDERYKKNVNSGLVLFDMLDTSAVDGGKLNDLKINKSVIDAIEKLWKAAPNVLLEHYMNFLSYIGCTLIFSNNKMFVVPDNSVLKKSGKAPSKGKIQSSPNEAGPADYVSYQYNDNGYRDIAGVVICNDGFVGGTSIGSLNWENGGVGYYMEDEGLSQASGIYVVQAHPWMALASRGPSSADSAKAADRMDKASDPMYKARQSMEQATTATKEDYASKTEKKKETVSQYAKDIFENFAQTKFYQMRYGDRQGTITMDFNPNWVPGTGGTLYVRETNSTLTFYVQSVTHHIDMSAPNNGTAITSVNYCCGRLGKESVGTSEDKFLGYNTGKESAVQKQFLSDMGV